MHITEPIVSLAVALSLLASGAAQDAPGLPPAVSVAERSVPPVLAGTSASATLLEQWHQASPRTSPPQRTAHKMTTDLATGRVVMFGGWDGVLYLGDTWEYDGVAWTASAGAGPGARALHGMAYDEARGVVLLFGGVFAPGQNGYLGDTWRYAGGVWTELSSAAFPPKRYDHAMAYDRTRGRIVMFGGRGASGSSLMGDTWEWNGTSWTGMLPATSPTRRAGHAMAFDPASGQVLLFGGIQIGGPIVGDTWTWDGSTWTQQFPAHAPSARWHAVMATDPSSGHVVLYGGFDGTDLTDTWIWDGSDWALASTPVQPLVSTLPAMSAGPAGKHIVLFGGEDAQGTMHADTWWYGRLARDDHRVPTYRPTN